MTSSLGPTSSSWVSESTMIMLNSSRTLMECVHAITVVSCSPASPLPIFLVPALSWAEHGSSSRRIFLFRTSARARQILCLSPPEQPAPRYPVLYLKPLGMDMTSS
mmetsp:Transcript_32997/g.105112  ORF Transcript_32997/g.105112 Transcript_32997/m.105112 type:complete len:106 (-) Transcript_32997:2099-2416(-)